VQHEPAQGSLDDPATFDDVEASGLGVSRYDLGVDTERGGVFDELVLETGVYPGFDDGRVLGFDLVQHLDPGGVLGHGRGHDDDGQEQP
jgi:hypothetical protein